MRISMDDSTQHSTGGFTPRSASSAVAGRAGAQTSPPARHRHRRKRVSAPSFTTDEIASETTTSGTASSQDRGQIFCGTLSGRGRGTTADSRRLDEDRLRRTQRSRTVKLIESSTQAFVRQLQRLSEQEGDHGPAGGASHTSTARQDSDYESDASDGILCFSDDPDELMSQRRAGQAFASHKRPYNSAPGASIAKRRRGSQTKAASLCLDCSDGPPRSLAPCEDACSDDLSSERPTAQQLLSAAGVQRIASFPTRAPGSMKKVAQVLKVLAEMHSALLAGTIVTKRDVYYRCPSLFGTQVVVDRIVDTLAARMGTSRWATGVTAASKGLVVGAADIYLDPRITQSREEASQGQVGSEGNRLEVRHTHETLIPALETIWDLSSPAKWVLVVEKEAVFRTLREAGVTKGCSSRGPQLGEGLMVTGKGYPDLITRDFLARLRSQNPRIPILVLVDYDPYGLHIFEQYRTHLPSGAAIHLLGLSADDLRGQLQTSSQRSHLGDWRPLTPADRRKITSMLEKGTSLSSEMTECHQDLDPLIRRELEDMLKHGLKAELEILSSVGHRPEDPSRRPEWSRHHSLTESSGRRPFQPILPPQAQSQPVGRNGAKRKQIHWSVAAPRQSQGEGEEEDGLVSYVQRKLAAFLAGPE